MMKFSSPCNYLFPLTDCIKVGVRLITQRMAGQLATGLQGTDELDYDSSCLSQIV